MNHNYLITYDNIELRPLKEEDLEMMRQWRNKDEIRRCFIYQGIIEKEQQIAWFEKYLDSENDLMFIIEEKKQLNRPVGAVSLYNLDKAAGTAEFGRLMIGDSEAGGKGLGYKATAALCDFGFRILGLEKIYLEVFKDNESAKKSYEKAGFKVDGERVLEGRELVVMSLYKDGVLKNGK